MSAWLIPFGILGFVAAALTEVLIRAGRLQADGAFPRRFQRLAGVPGAPCSPGPPFPLTLPAIRDCEPAAAAYDSR